MDIINFAIFITLAYSVATLPQHKFSGRDPLPWLIPVKHLPEIHHYSDYNSPKLDLGHEIEYRRPKVELKGPYVDDHRPETLPPVPSAQKVVDATLKLGLLFFTGGLRPSNPALLGNLPAIGFL